MFEKEGLLKTVYYVFKKEFKKRGKRGMKCGIGCMLRLIDR
jgi:hypothetical protein